MNNLTARVLVLGYGNPGRRDDGLGPCLAQRLDAFGWPCVTVETTCQLNIEHAQIVAEHDIVVFADAAVNMKADARFYLRRVEARPEEGPFSHALSPPAVLHLAERCFGARPKGWLLGIRPVDVTSFEEGLTAEAEGNLTAALGALCNALESGSLAG